MNFLKVIFLSSIVITNAFAANIRDYELRLDSFEAIQLPNKKFDEQYKQAKKNDLRLTCAFPSEIKISGKSIEFEDGKLAIWHLLNRDSSGTIHVGAVLNFESKADIKDAIKALEAKLESME